MIFRSHEKKPKNDKLSSERLAQDGRVGNWEILHIFKSSFELLVNTLSNLIEDEEKIATHEKSELGSFTL